MVCYTDIYTGDEICSEDCKIIDIGDGIWELEGKMVQPKPEEFFDIGQDRPEEVTKPPVFDLAEQCRWTKVKGGEEFTKRDGHMALKLYVDAVAKNMRGAPEEEINKVRNPLLKAASTILLHWQNYDLYKTESSEDVTLPIFVTFRKDGTTPYATVMKAGLKKSQSGW